MALLTLNIWSDSLQLNTQVNVFLPQTKGNAPPPQVMYIMNGGFCDNTFMSRMTLFEEYIQGYNLAVIMPCGSGRYFYRNLPDHEQWWDYYTIELPQIVHGMFKLSVKREDTFVLGGSGGGYAALKFALDRPDIVGVGVGMNAMLLGKRTQETMKVDNPGRYREFVTYFGDPFPAEFDSFEILKSAAKKDPKPELFMCCGFEDGLFQLDKDYYNLATELGFTTRWDERPGGHTMAYGAEMYPVMLDWLPLTKL